MSKPDMQKLAKIFPLSLLCLGLLCLGLLFLGLLFFGGSARAETVILQSTTSTQNSGFYEYLLPIYEATSGDAVRVVAVGTGQALTNGRRCDGDVLLIHSTQDELKFVADGYGLYRKPVMYNDFVLVGPRDDPADLATAKTAIEAFQRIFDRQARFVSRGDNSGTHKSERARWQQAMRAPQPFSGSWYLETGAGMGATLNTAIELNAYTYSDRATWLKFGNHTTQQSATQQPTNQQRVNHRRAGHKILFEGDPTLLNQYGVVPINPSHCPHSKSSAAERFVFWLTSPAGQQAIAGYQINGQPLFTPNANEE